MKKLLLFFCVVIIVGCEENSSSQIYFGGKILKPTDSQVLLYGDDTLIDSIPIEPNGRFLKQLDSLPDGLYNFIHKPEFQYVLLEKGDSLLVRINTIDFDESLVFSGKGAAKNNFLIDVYLQFEKDNQSIYSHYQKSPTLFKNHVDSLISIQLERYQKLVQKNSLSNLAKSFLKAAVYYNYFTKMEQYSYFHRSHPDCVHLNEIQESFYDYRKELNVNDVNLSAFRPYLRYLIARTDNEARALLPKKSSPSTTLIHKTRLEFVDTHIEEAAIRNKIARYIAYDYLLGNKKIKDADPFLSLFNSMSLDNEVFSEIRNLTSNIKALQPGDLLPDVSLSDAEGNLKSLSNIQNQTPTVFFFWSYDQNAHQLSMFSRIRELSKKHPNVSFVGININNKRVSWEQVLKTTPKFRGNVYQFQAENFKELSKKLVLSNLNKIIYTNANNRIVDGFSNIVTVHKYLD